MELLWAAGSVPNNIYCDYYLEMNDETEAIQAICHCADSSTSGKTQQIVHGVLVSVDMTKSRREARKYEMTISCNTYVLSMRGNVSVGNQFRERLPICPPKQKPFARGAKAERQHFKSQCTEVWSWKKMFSLGTGFTKRSHISELIDKEREAEKDELAGISEHNRNREQTKSWNWRQWSIVGKPRDLDLHKCRLDSVLPLST